MKRIVPTLCCLLTLAISCQKTDDIRPIYPTYPPVVDTVVPEQPVPALFSVSDSQQVRFATGNLQYIEGHWRFAEHQSDFLGHFDPNHCDLFTWPCNNSNWGLDTTTYDWLHYNSDFTDWGTNPSLIADLGNGWRTLSADEWDYLLNHRKVDGSAGEGHSWIAARIEGQYGLIIYPDGYAQQTATLGTIPDSCVFLPAPGSRHGNRLYYTGDERGFYRTSSRSDEIKWFAYHLSFHQSYSTTILDISYSDLEMGLAVRLVRDI